MRKVTMTRLWLAMTFLVLVIPVAHGLREPLASWLTVPDTPFDRTNSRLASEWRLLESARPYISRGSTFTVTAKDLTDETMLFMMSYAVLPQGKPLPSSYLWDPTPRIGAHAEYVISLGCDRVDDSRILFRAEEGCIAWRPRT
jgi:hypothetical protein